MAMTKEEQRERRNEAYARRREEWQRFIAEIESANTTREEYAKREERIRQAEDKARG